MSLRRSDAVEILSFPIQFTYKPAWFSMEVLKDYNDGELTFLLAGNDPASFEKIYRRYAAALLRYCQNRIGSREDSEEIIHDVFESLWNRRRELLHVTALGPYLFTMVKYKIVDYIRHSNVRKKFEEHYVLFEAVYENLSSQTENPLELQALIDKSILDLPDRCQTAFRLRLNDNLPYKDIAVRMNISIKTVEKHIGAALRHLREAYRKAAYRAG